MQNSRHVSLLTSGQDQVLTIPSEFALSATEVVLRKEGDTESRKTIANARLRQRQRLIIEPIASNSLLSLLTTLQDITDNFPDIDEGLSPLDDLTLVTANTREFERVPALNLENWLI